MIIPRPNTRGFSGLFRRGDPPQDDTTPRAPRPPEPAWAGWAWSRACLVLTAALHTLAFPPYNVPEAAYVCAVAVALWTLRRPRWPEFLVVVFGASWVSWLLLLEWLHHVTWGGMIALAAVMALFPTAWFAALRTAWPRAAERDPLARLLVMFGLAGLWVVLEWTRGWFLTGFPWLPLAASQWQRPIVLQAASWGGAWIVSFALILFNLGLAAYLKRLQLWVRERRGRFCPEFYVGLGFLFVLMFGAINDVPGQRREALLRAGFMQPYIPQSEKWDPAQARGILDVLETQTKKLRPLDPDAIFWPEAVAPMALVGNPEMQAWVEKLSRDLGKPIVLGAIAYEPPAAAVVGAPEVAGGGVWHNGIFAVDPVLGLQPHYYDKRHLVPFGEYVPLRRFIPWVEKFVPIGGDFTPGTDPGPLSVRTATRTIAVGGLVCFEDVFPSLAREAVRAGAEVLFVATNDAWYGETGAAYQHAAHSVLRAVETRRPVMRVGNGGWSGWIDEYGIIRAVERDEKNSVYHRGGAVFVVDRDARWAGKTTYYVRWGDWFVGLCALLAVAAGNSLAVAESRARRKSSPAAVPPPARP